MIILSKETNKSETNIHLNITVINKGPSELFLFNFFFFSFLGSWEGGVSCWL